MTNEMEKAEVKLKEIVPKVIEIEKQVEAIEIKNNDEMGIASDMAKTIKLEIKRIEDERTELVKPLNDTVKKINAKYKPYTDKLKSVISKIDDKRRVYQLEEIKRREEAERKRREAEKAEAAKRAEELADVAANTKDETFFEMAENVEKEAEKIDTENVKVKNKAYGGLSMSTSRDNWVYTIVSESQVPAQYKSIDDKKVKAAIKAGAREITGLKIENKPIMIDR